MIQTWKPVSLEQIITDEIEVIRAKRKNLDFKDNSKNPSNLFGIALSGGGIRSATINLRRGKGVSP